MYDTDKGNAKLLCVRFIKSVECRFFSITIYKEKDLYELKLSDENEFKFLAQNDFSDKNCYLSKFNNEYLLCCAITDYIKCFKINYQNYNTKKNLILKWLEIILILQLEIIVIM